MLSMRKNCCCPWGRTGVVYEDKMVMSVRKNWCCLWGRTGVVYEEELMVPTRKNGVVYEEEMVLSMRKNWWCLWGKHGVVYEEEMVLSMAQDLCFMFFWIWVFATIDLECLFIVYTSALLMDTHTRQTWHSHFLSGSQRKGKLLNCIRLCNMRIEIVTKCYIMYL